MGIVERNRLRRRKLDVLREERIPWDHCVDCGEPIYHQTRGSHPRCNYHMAVEHGFGV